MAALVDIFNQALSHIGNKSVQSPEEGGAAESCRRFYAQCRDWLLRRYPWNFARRRVALSDTGEPPSTWAYSYVYPSDCLAVLSLVLPGVRVPRRDQQVPFEVAFDGTRRVIYTDLAQAEMIYTARVENTTLFDPNFVAALSWFLAAEIAMPLSVDAKIAAACRDTAERMAMTAMAQDASEGFSGPEPMGEFMGCRA